MENVPPQESSQLSRNRSECKETSLAGYLDLPKSKAGKDVHYWHGDTGVKMKNQRHGKERKQKSCSMSGCMTGERKVKSHLL